jgi:hypothetical protein
VITRILRGAVVATGLFFLALCFIVGPAAAAAVGAIGGVIIALGLMIGGDAFHRRVLERLLQGLGAVVVVVAAMNGARIPVLLWAVAAVLMVLLPLRPRRRRQAAAHSWRSDWTPVRPRDGRVEIGAASVDAPAGWEAWRAPSGTDAEQTVIIHPTGRRFGIPVPGLIVARGPADGSIEAALDEILRQRVPADAPIELDNLRRSQLWIGGEPATAIEGEARVRRHRLPGPGFAWRIGMWIAGIGTLRGSIAFVDHESLRYGIGWVAWAGSEEAARAAFAAAVSTWRWSG